MTWMSYGSSWRGSGQIPARAVCGEGEQNGLNPPPARYGQPCIDHFGYVDPTEGGDTQRHMLSLAYQTAWHDTDFQATAYLLRYRFTLYSDFTFHALDPARGDEIEQNDDRDVAGLDFHVHRQSRIGPVKFTTTVGAQARFDGIENSLYHDQARRRLETRVKAGISESELAVYVEEDARLNRYLRFILGLRGQRADVNVDDQREAAAMTNGNGSGVKGAGLLLPKAMAVLSPIPELDLFVDYGRGFHSNDARGAVLARNAATLLTPATGYELGVRVKPVPEASLSAAAFLLDLDSELVWSGDEGTTSPSGRTRRYGLELDARYRLKSWLFADADATFTRARYRENAGNGQAVALAPTRTVSAGIGARPTFGDVTPFASLRVKSIGPRPATEDASLVAEGFTVVDANAGARWKNLELGVDAENLFGATWREVEFASVTRLPFEPKPVRGITYSPGWPRTVMARATLYWR
jgi:outer membrane receptor protein involved in Fe transport